MTTTHWRRDAQGSIAFSRCPGAPHAGVVRLSRRPRGGTDVGSLAKTVTGVAGAGAEPCGSCAAIMFSAGMRIRLMFSASRSRWPSTPGRSA